MPAHAHQPFSELKRISTQSITYTARTIIYAPNAPLRKRYATVPRLYYWNMSHACIRTYLAVFESWLTFSTQEEVHQVPHLDHALPQDHPLQAPSIDLIDHFTLICFTV